MKDKKGQAALEFLMTYGWAILVVLVVIGALAYFGVLNPNILVPEKCTLATGISCDDYTMSATDDLMFRFGNGMGRDVIVTKVNVTGTPGTAGGSASAECVNSTFTTPNDLISNGGSREIIVPCTVAFTESSRKSKASIQITYHYADSDSTFSHTVTGELMAKVAP